MKNKIKTVLLFTVHGTGHNLVYANIVIKTMIRKGYRIDLAIPENCVNSDAYTVHILPLIKDLNIIKHSNNTALKVRPKAWLECLNLKHAILAEGRNYDAILAVNCSQIPFFWPIFKIFHSKSLKDIPDIKFGMISTGLDYNEPTIKTKFSNLIRKLLLSLHSEGAIKTIDNCGYTLLQKHSHKFQKIYSLIPDPMDTIPVIDKVSARQYFSIPESVFVVSISGSISSHPRKNCQLLINAVSDPKMNENVCLVIAGKLGRDINEKIRKSQAFLEKRIFIIDRYLSDQELTTVTCASDVVCTPYQGHFCPSGIILRAFKCGVPTLVPNYHWFKFMVDKFNVGWTLKSLTESALIDALNDISENETKLTHTEVQKSLIKQYFSEDNFAAHWLSQFEENDIYSFDELLVQYNSGN